MKLADARERVRCLSVGAAWVLVGAYVLFALLIMWRAPRVPYADGWRFLGDFAEKSFAGGVFLADNGHYEVLPNAVRVLEMHLFGANQGLQVVVGIALLLATLVVGRRLLRQLQPPELRAAAALALVMGVCWLGNVRALSHANESVHAYAVTLFLLFGTYALTRRKGGPTLADAGLASVCGLLAALSFGSGIAVFVSFVMIAVLLRASWRIIGVLCAAAAVVLLLVRAGGGAELPGPDPVRQLDLTLRWLSAPWLYALWPAVDPAVAERIPTSLLQGLLGRSASGWESTFGPVALSRWPHVLISGAGVAALLLSSVRVWRSRGDKEHARIFGLVLAWFALAVGGMVAMVRMTYFDTHPEQLLATRYVVWSSLFWAGLGISVVAGAARPARALMITVAVALALLPSQLWMSQLAESLRNAADQTAVAAAVGVLDPELATGETVRSELAAALPALQAAGTAVFAWPESAVLGDLLPDHSVAVPVLEMEVAPVANVLGAPGRRVRMQTGGAGGDRLLLVDHDGIIRGMAIEQAGAGNAAWIGWMQGEGTGGPVRVARLPAD